MSEINYSIIIPHKNIPDLLQRCLNSIPRRKDIQIIVVDDDSDSDKVDFEHFPGVGEECVEVYFTKEGKGAGYARNVGLNYAKGKWLLFADADDFYVRDFISVIDEDVKKEVDIVFYNATSVYSDNLQKNDRSKHINNKIAIYDHNDINSSNMVKYTIYDTWMKMFNRNFIKINHILFNEVISGNDVYFSIQSAFLAKEIFVNKKVIYCVTVRKGSLTFCNQKDVLKSRINVLLENNRFLKSNQLYKYRANIIPLYYQLYKISHGEFIKYLLLNKWNAVIIFNDFVYFIYLKVKRHIWKK